MSNKHTIIKKIEKDSWEKALNESFKKNVKNAEVDGFRKGKCPRNVFEKKYGKESLYNDAIDALLPTLYSEVLKESNLIPVIQPSIDIKNIDENGVELEFVITTKPEVKVNKYKNLGVKKEKVTVTKKEIDEEITRLRNQYAEIEIKTGAIEKGDTAVIDFEGFKDGIAFEGGKGENYPLEIGSNTFIPGFEDALIGLKSEEEKDINVTFPEDYPSDELKGKEVVFKVKVHEIKHRVLPEINEELFDDLGLEGVNSKEELENHVKEDLTNKKEGNANNKFIDNLLEEIAKNVEIELEEEIIHEEIHAMIHNIEDRFRMQGLSLEQYLQFTKKTMEDMEKDLEPEAKKNLTYRFMLEEIAKLEKIDATEEDVEKEIEDLTKMYNMTKEEIINAFGNKEIIKNELINRKTLEFLENNN